MTSTAANDTSAPVNDANFINLVGTLLLRYDTMFGDGKNSGGGHQVLG
jgi:hypothetical protein